MVPHSGLQVWEPTANSGTFVMLTVWIALVIVWCLLDLPIGPGIGTR